MEHSAVEFIAKHLKKFDPFSLRKVIEQAREMELKQRQEDTNHGYAQGYDDGAAGKEPMRPSIKD